MLRKFTVASAVFILMGTLLSGCSSYVEYQLLQRAEPIGMPTTMPEVIAEAGMESRQFCMPHLGGCTGYLYAPPKTETNKSSWDFTMAFTDRTVNYQLELDREQIPEARRGTMILLHGFGGSKETMYLLADYYRFLGFHVVIPDLQGHGASSHDEPGFGVLDADIIDTLINSLPARERPHPLYLTGFSMGAVAAAHVASRRDDISGMLLFAPMRDFAEAAWQVSKMTHARSSKIVTEEAIKEGVHSALAHKQLQPEQLDLLQLLPAIKVPTLILASEHDKVAPYSYFAPLQSESIQVTEVAERNHFVMMIMDQPLHQQLYPWLQQH